MKKILLLFNLLVACFSHAQVNYTTHSQLLLQAHRANEKEEYKNALDLYTQAFAINGANAPIEYVKAALAAAELNEPKQCTALLREAVIKEKLTQKTILTFSENQIYLASAQTILFEYDSLIEQHYANIENPAVFFKIQHLINRDQYSRKVGEYYLNVNEEEQEEAFEKLSDPEVKKDTALYNKYKVILFPKNDPAHQAFQRKAMITADSLNIVELIEITKKYGWQKEAWLLLWHQRGSYGQSNWVWDYFKPLIDQEIIEGKVAPFYWAIFEDITAIYKTGQSIYGYHPGKVDAATVNEKRKSIGLPMLNETEIEERNNNPYGGRTY